MIFEEWYEPCGMMLQSGRDKGSLSIAWKAGVASRDAEVAELRDQVTLLRDAIETACNHIELHSNTNYYTVGREALAATDPGSTYQDKAAIFKSLGLVPWDNKPPACTDTVWIEPGRVATKESQGSNP